MSSLMDFLEPCEPARSAIVSHCGKYRYVLTRTWGPQPPLVFVMLNPSIADANTDDQTVRKCIGFAKREKCGGIVIVNLYAWRSTDPAGLKKTSDPVGPDNDGMIRSVLAGPCEKVVVAWGANGGGARVVKVLNIILAAGKVPWCFGYTTSGQPLHPLVLGYCMNLVEFSR